MVCELDVRLIEIAELLQVRQKLGTLRDFGNICSYANTPLHLPSARQLEFKVRSRKRYKSHFDESDPPDFRKRAHILSKHSAFCSQWASCGQRGSILTLTFGMNPTTRRSYLTSITTILATPTNHTEYKKESPALLSNRHWHLLHAPPSPRPINLLLPPATFGRPRNLRKANPSSFNTRLHTPLRLVPFSTPNRLIHNPLQQLCVSPWNMSFIQGRCAEFRSEKLEEWVEGRLPVLSIGVPDREGREVRKERLFEQTEEEACGKCHEAKVGVDRVA
jgi:hypothetical protein